MSKNQIEVEKDFVVTYNCHTDEYIVEGSVAGSKGIPRWIKGWELGVANDCTHVVREIIRETKAAQKVTWGLRKSTKKEDYNDDQKYGKSQTIRWTLKIRGGGSSEIFVFVNSSANGLNGQVNWNLNVPKKDLMSQLSPRIINKIQWEDGFDDFSGMGKLSGA